MLRNELKIAIRFTILTTVLLGILYPLFFATSVLLMYDEGGSEQALIGAAVGASVMGVWSAVATTAATSLQQERRQGTLELLVGLGEVIQVEVRVTQRDDELARLQVRHLGHHQREQRVGGDVEGHAQEDVGASLVHLAGELAVGHVELEEGVAGHERHLRQVRDIPGRHHHAPR